MHVNSSSVLPVPRHTDFHCNGVIDNVNDDVTDDVMSLECPTTRVKISTGSVCCLDGYRTLTRRRVEFIRGREV